MAHLRGCMIVQLNEAFQPVHDTFPASFSQAHNNVLNRTVAITLLVRQTLERIDQFFTQSLWDCMRLGTDFLGSSLQHGWTRTHLSLTVTLVKVHADQTSLLSVVSSEFFQAQALRGASASDHSQCWCDLVRCDSFLNVVGVKKTPSVFVCCLCLSYMCVSQPAASAVQGFSSHLFWRRLHRKVSIGGSQTQQESRSSQEDLWRQREEQLEKVVQV